jgi:hypothetical protein
MRKDKPLVTTGAYYGGAIAAISRSVVAISQASSQNRSPDLILLLAILMYVVGRRPEMLNGQFTKTAWNTNIFPSKVLNIYAQMNAICLI